MTIRFFVPGVPAPGGSKKQMRSFQTGKIITMEDCKRTKPWRDTVASFAIEAMVGRVPIEGPLYVAFFFLMPRPKGHYGAGKNASKLKPAAPRYHASKPDATKLVRSTEDACTGIVWRDDGAIARQSVEKRYVLEHLGESPGVFIEVSGL